jgi:hypothetical protein
MTQDDKIHDLLFGVRRSIRYHSRRRAFFDRLNLSVNALALILGSVTVYGLLKANGGPIALIAAAAVTTLSAINLVVGSAIKARNHHDLVKRFISLEKKIVADQEPETSQLIGWTQERLDIEAEEPPIMRVLDCMCHNELARAMGYGSEHFAKIRFYQRWFAQIADIGVHAIRIG